MPFLPALLSWAPMTTIGSRPGGPMTDLPTVTRPLHPAPRAMIAAPRAMSGPVMPGVRRTPGRLRGGDARGGPDLPPCPGYRTPYMGGGGGGIGGANPFGRLHPVLPPPRGLGYF